MNDCIDLGCAPPMEECAQVGTPDYYERARRECRAFINLFRRTLGPEPIGARLSIKGNPHDFGTYLSVICGYDIQHPESVDYAVRCESQSPDEWDDEALRELDASITVRH